MRILTRENGLKMVQPCEVTFVVIARNATKEPHRLVVSSIGVAIPSGKNQYGYFSEHYSFGQTDEAAGDYAEDLALLCWRQQWAFNSTQKQHGMNENSFLKLVESSSKQSTSHSQQRETRAVCGQQP